MTPDVRKFVAVRRTGVQEVSWLRTRAGTQARGHARGVEPDIESVLQSLERTAHPLVVLGVPPLWLGLAPLDLGQLVSHGPELLQSPDREARIYPPLLVERELDCRVGSARGEHVGAASRRRTSGTRGAAGE